ncbi:MAG TPA: M23 family metallopeptidase [Vicinamibacterales bacterium]|nr:M23 family metallopeptidase [Vicinamibacterales bacterium]
MSRRYTIVLADRRTGVVRRFTVGLWPTVAAGTFVLALPVLIGTGAALKARSDVAALYASAAALDSENANYRAATEALSGQIRGLQSAINELGANAALDPSLASAMDRLPAVVKNRAMGGAGSTPSALGSLPALQSPENTFGLLREILEGIESRLTDARSDVERRNALAAATPSIWPAHGWLSSSVGRRTDPINGGDDFHHGLDISADAGSPIYATADGTVTLARREGAYGNLATIDHGYGLETRYGHMSKFEVKAGAKVKRGEMIGRVGSTGRATGPHLHYEVRVNGRLLNPLQLLLQQRR